MPRRTLRKIDTSLDYSRHLFTFPQLPQPWDLCAIFPEHPEAPLEVEVGSGKGHFLRAATRQFPEHHFLGVEIAPKYAAYCAAHLIRENIMNAAMISADAMQVFRERLPGNSIYAVHVYFPDPWWKKRHRKRRIMRLEFIREVERCLIPGGKLHFWTDVQEYFDSTLEMMAAESILEGPYSLNVEEETWRTHFEKRTLLEARPVFRTYFTKKISEYS
ncbi:MAG: tRNA (guanosine(46)-N7)-methyltransferase TrmB [Planctomycetia bacterium]|nr:tRNA (guanosine(46)-N7)-methyltransferase TrmB [Planctomycetia bacterium]